jgi:hypothetical protein
MKFSTFLSLMALSALSYAGVGDQVQCPGNTRFVTIGDSLSVVTQTCGPAKKVLSKKIHADSGTSAQQARWYYGNPYGLHNQASSIITFSANDQVSSIHAGANQQLNCPRGVPQVGDSMQKVIQKCGQPNSKVTNQQLGYAKVHTNKALGQGTHTLTRTSQPFKKASSNGPQLVGQHSETMMIYQPHPYMPKMGFLFLDGKLAQTGAVAK